VASLAALVQRYVPASLLARLMPLLAGREKPAILAAGALLLALIGYFLLWSGGSGYSVLFAGLSSEEGGRTLAELQKLNIAYRITEGGRVILVPSSEVGRARLQLAARGVPKQESNDWAILDNASLGVSPFVEQVHYIRGIEAALARTIREVDGVVSAKVTLAVPKQTDFLSSAPKPSASVLLRLRQDTQLSPNQVDGIIGLVSSSVPGLSRDNVAIVDQTGRSLSGTGRDGMQQIPQQLELAREITRRYEAVVTELLVPVLGRGNFRVSADADIDFSQSKESLVRYGEGHVLSQDETIHTRSSDGTDQPIGIPGALSNRRPDTPVVAPPKPAPPAQAPTPPQAAPGAAETPAPTPPPPPADTHKTINYDLDKTVQYLEHPSWRLRSISLAVLVNNASGTPLPPERIKSVQTLVASAIGAAQNPHITVVDLPFEGMAASGGEPGVWWKQPWMAAAEQNALLALGGLFALFGGVLPLLRRVATAAAVPVPARPRAGGARAPGAAAVAAVAAAGTAASASAGGGGSLSEPLSALMAAQDVFSIEAETVQTLVANDPARTAQVIRGWMAGDRNHSKRAV
jgi:flagellar M-ring protein FliF